MEASRLKTIVDLSTTKAAILSIKPRIRISFQGVLLGEVIYCIIVMGPAELCFSREFVSSSQRLN